MFIAKFQGVIFKMSIMATALLVCGPMNADVPNSLTPTKVLSLLLEGNDHFVKGEMKHLSYATEAKNKLLEKQTPMAAIVGCSDSRVPPELIFDRGLGELFVVRVAGNVIGPIEMDSVEFAVERLKVPLVMVVGHQNCGAVNAVFKKENIPEIETIYPMIDGALKNCTMNITNSLVNAIECNVKKGVDVLKKSPTLAPLIAQQKVKVVGAYFDFESGKISLISD
jgi:carbonic anhydrase